MKPFTDKEIKDYVNYVGDSYTQSTSIGQFVPKDVLKIMDYFYAINKMVEEAQRRYEHTR